MSTEKIIQEIKEYLEQNGYENVIGKERRFMEYSNHNVLSLTFISDIESIILISLTMYDNKGIIDKVEYRKHYIDSFDNKVNTISYDNSIGKFEAFLSKYIGEKLTDK